MPLVRGDDAFREVGVRVAVVALVALVAALVLAWAPLVAVAATLVGGVYAAELAVSDAPLDAAAPAIAAGLLLGMELAYWSLDERRRWLGDAGDSLRRSALVVLLGAGAFLTSAVVLALVDAVRARGLALDLLGALAAAAVLVAILLASRSQSSRGS